ncbi:hydroxyectoine utilization dehydratase EutB [Agrobacterium tumefaciens]|uniref:hydroxyectoine utilization dehydratase EutB n=1 Tax=Agrobacterium tumefaciens TaxID=358 RepID=UPI001574D2EC|nr:hydroxyectoine utilization dehydratase EutB [Agrobacterium tumefaciens]NTB99764.1 hydroxyectoine utilization dehydratase EutB [Agrobacterium tumefaciens]NTB99783.1 hydroxyectoine utilization dehydratase EutB [Agrobacterium tumefaciens]NTC47541.1 hydroxyectoine utilization dehydratase EutB [Agrobacterium tumefaciens]NTC47560.1 hydroxyectoine utilization dehydratase EutB [Agrobacterium tumefaciens]
MTIMKSENLSISADKNLLPVSLAAIERAAVRLAGQVERTPLVRSDNLSERCGHPVHLKLETLQPIGAFKLRGAMNAILSLDEEARRRGLVTASTGNHGRAVAYAASKLGIPATICMSALVPANKVEAIRALGAEIRIVGRSQDDAQEEVERLTASRGLTAIPPFDDADVVAGQGTIGLEIVEDMPGLATVLVPLSGGGLAGGIAVAVKALKPRARVIGISMERGAAMQASVAAGRPVVVREEETLADSLGGGIGLENRVTFALCQQLLEEIVLVSEDEIAAGIRHAAREEGLTVEGAGAVGFAAIMSRKIDISGPTAIIVSGGNIDPAVHRTIIDGGAA